MAPNALQQQFRGLCEFSALHTMGLQEYSASPLFKSLGLPALVNANHWGASGG